MKDILDGVAAGFIILLGLCLGYLVATAIYNTIGPSTLLIVGLVIAFIWMLLWSISRFTHPRGGMVTPEDNLRKIYEKHRPDSEGSLGRGEKRS